MIENELQQVTIFTNFEADIVDEYGQRNYDNIPASKGHSGKMYIKQYSQTNTNNVLYQDVILTALTKDAVNINDVILYDNKYYGIKNIIPTRRYSQLFLTDYANKRLNN